MRGYNESEVFWLNVYIGKIKKMLTISFPGRKCSNSMKMISTSKISIHRILAICLVIA